MTQISAGRTPATDEIAPPAETASERRLVRRVAALWVSRCADGRFPRPREINAELLGGDWPRCFILDVERSRNFPFFLHLGDDVRDYCGVLLSGEDDWRCTLLTKATERAPDVVRSGAPLPVEDVLTRFDGKKLAFRVILLPLSDRPDEAVTHVLGAVSGRLFEPRETPAA